MWKALTVTLATLFAVAGLLIVAAGIVRDEVWGVTGGFLVLLVGLYLLGYANRV